MSATAARGTDGTYAADAELRGRRRLLAAAGAVATRKVTAGRALAESRIVHPRSMGSKCAYHPDLWLKYLPDPNLLRITVRAHALCANDPQKSARARMRVARYRLEGVERSLFTSVWAAHSL